MTLQRRQRLREHDLALGEDHLGVGASRQQVALDALQQRDGLLLSAPADGRRTARQTAKNDRKTKHLFVDGLERFGLVDAANDVDLLEVRRAVTDRVARLVILCRRLVNALCVRPSQTHLQSGWRVRR